jgi:hypothetical protein
MLLCCAGRGLAGGEVVKTETPEELGEGDSVGDDAQGGKHAVGLAAGDVVTVGGRLLIGCVIAVDAIEKLTGGVASTASCSRVPMY